MKALVTGSSGHLGEALMRVLVAGGHDAIGLDRVEGPCTDYVASIVDRASISECVRGVDTVFHTATLHKPHIGTHSRQEFVDVNITGTLNLLEEAAESDVASFVFTSTTSVFGDALEPPPGAPAAWITEEVMPVPKNIYGVTKLAAENLCRLFHRNRGLPCVVLRTSRFFPEEDDSRTVRETYADANAKVNEFLFRRADLEDVVSAHLLAAERAQDVGFGTYIISATTPFRREDLADLRSAAPEVARRYVPEYEAEYARRDWSMVPGIDRVYVNQPAREELGWLPAYDFRSIIARLRAGEDFRSSLARLVGTKGYHDEVFADGPYPVE